MPSIILISQRHELTTARFKRLLKVRSHAEWSRIAYHPEGDPRRTDYCRGDRDSVISRGVVAQHDLRRRIALIDDAAQLLGDERRSIAGSDGDRDPRPVVTYHQ